MNQFTFQPDLHHASQILSALEAHKAAWTGYSERGINCVIDPSDKENSFIEDWQIGHYFSVGEDALRLVMSQLLINRRALPMRILDFPCGSGRATRHFRAMFPDAEIGACDLYQSHVEFCSEQFGAIPIPSRENLDELDVGTWDVIFCGSLLTHLPIDQFRQALRFMARSLSPQGIALVTIEGRHSVFIQDNKWKLIGDDLFEVARKGYNRTGFGYVDYRHDFRAANFQKQESYGVALVKPSYITAILQENSELTILGVQERAWDDHQDLVVFGRPGVND